MSVELSSHSRKRFRCCMPVFCPLKPQLRRIKPEILPFLPADDGRFERSIPVAHHIEGGARFRGC